MSQFTRRLVRIGMYGGRVVEGNIHVTEGQSLTVYLTTRRYLTSLTEARWIGNGAQVLSHLAIRTDKIVFATSLDDKLPVSTNAPPTLTPRWAEFTFEDDSVMRVGLHIAEEQRMTDYFDSGSAFMPAIQATIVGQDRLLGPVALNTSRILAVREIESKPE